MKVSAVSLGGWINFGESKVSTDNATRIVDTAYEQGINYFDLADVYAKGEAEKQMGSVLSRYPRHTVVIASKDRGLSRKHIMESIDKTLARLGTDYLDIYFCHRPDPETPVVESVRAMNDLVRRGKVLYWGTSEWQEDQLAEAYAVCERYGYDKPQAEQPQYSMLYREPVESSVLPMAQAHGTGLVCWSPLAQGMLTGKYDEGVSEDSRFGREPWAADAFMNDANARKVRDLKPIADELGITRAQLALAWVLRQHGVSSVITGATKPEQVLDNVKAASVTLSPDVLARIEMVLSGSAGE
jgi:voltage-dependent potassium channel beta subunit